MDASSSVDAQEGEQVSSEQQEDTVLKEDPEKLSLKHKDDGNRHYAAKQYPEAVKCYRAGIAACTDKELEITLRANLAVTLLKLQDYERAQEECNLALKLDTTNPKVWYRRGLALEGLASVNHEQQQQRTRLLQEARSDLKMCMVQIDATLQQTTQTMKRAAQAALERIERELKTANGKRDTDTSNEYGDTMDQVVAHETNGNHNRENNHSSASVPPLPKRQRQDVARLLLARNTTTQYSMEGEAFFLLDWNWWTRWCQHVDFYYQKEDTASSLQKQRHETILRMLPPGAMLPTSNSSNDDSNDGSSSSSSSSSSSKENDEKEKHQGPPGAIDNSALLEPVIRKQHSLPRLKPNLVRGHHYELIPREVYNALRIWYGEVTPSICRRVIVHEEVAKLPLYTDFTTHSTPNGQLCGACRAPSAASRCTRCYSVHYCGRSCQESHWPFHKNVCKQLAAGHDNDDGNAHDGAPTTQETNGRVGLHNLGNTCFMNSALQCLSHATPLTRHFLSNQFKLDLNACNPLGTGGKLAHAYDNVLRDLWLKRNVTSTSPTELKRAIAQFAPRFAGCSQHDAQEFLAYLLDGLHEDLNRIRKPPYVKMPEAVGMDNIAIAGAKAWDAHRRRNDSLVMDTFYGQFKSTCVCPKCNRVSVSFDAFNHVSLEIPQQTDTARVIPIILFREEKDGTWPMRYGVTVKRGSFTVDLRRALSELCGIPPARLFICDVCEHSIFEILKDTKPVSTIRSSDILVAYEVDPYANTTIHTVAAHALVHERIVHESDDKQNNVTTELEASAELSSEESSLEAFGFPFLTAFDAHSTCREVWDHVWRTFTTTMAPEFIKGGDEETLKSLLQIRIVDDHGKSRPIFLDEVDASDVLGSNEEMNRASILPPTSDKELMKYLGEDCADRFLLIRLEWTDKAMTSISKEEKVEEAAVVAAIDKETFLRFENHPSLIEAIEKARQAQFNKGVSLDQCFQTFTKPERLDEHNMWYCSRCKEHVRAMKTMELWRLPDILVVHLKRFEFKHTLRRDKLDTLVSFPLDGLDMSKHCASTQSGDNPFVEDNVPAQYDLFAVINHYGRMGFGHYTAFARRWDEHGMLDDWALFDDSSVRSVGDGRGRDMRGGGIVSSAAYVLFYRRRNCNY